jgi:DNA primase
MTGEELKEFMRMMGCHKIKEYSTNVIADCPFARFSHAGGTDKKPSFSVKKDSSKSVGKCFSCGEKGTVLQLAKTYADHTGDYAPVDYVRQAEMIGIHKDFSPKTFATMKHNSFREMDFQGMYYQEPEFNEDDITELEWVKIERYMGQVPQYILGRGVTIDTCKAYKIGHDKKRKAVVFPMIDRRMRLVGYTLRKYKGFPKYLHSVGMKKSLFLYGEHLIRNKVSELFIVEGHIDVLKMHQFGYNAMAIQGSSVSSVQKNKILDVVKDSGTVYIMSDGDVAGLKLANDLEYALKDRAYTKKITLKDGEDPGDFTNKQDIEAYLGRT